MGGERRAEFLHGSGALVDRRLSRRWNWSGAIVWMSFFNAVNRLCCGGAGSWLSCSLNFIVFVVPFRWRRGVAAAGPHAPGTPPSRTAAPVAYTARRPVEQQGRLVGRQRRQRPASGGGSSPGRGGTSMVVAPCGVIRSRNSCASAESTANFSSRGGVWTTGEGASPPSASRHGPPSQRPAPWSGTFPPCPTVRTGRSPRDPGRSPGTTPIHRRRTRTGTPRGPLNSNWNRRPRTVLTRLTVC